MLALALLPLDRWVTGSSLGFGFLWGGNGAYLLHQAQGVPVLPLLDDLALFDTMDSDPSDHHLIASGGYAHQLALVGALCAPSANDFVRFGYIVLKCYAQLGDGGTYHGDELL